MSSIMRWRNGLMGLSVMAITPVSHEVSEPHDFETGRAILFIPTSNPPRARSCWGVYRESGLVHGGIADIRLRNADAWTTFQLRCAPALDSVAHRVDLRSPSTEGPPMRLIAAM